MKKYLLILVSIISLSILLTSCETAFAVTTSTPVEVDDEVYENDSRITTDVSVIIRYGTPIYYGGYLNYYIYNGIYYYPYFYDNYWYFYPYRTAFRPGWYPRHHHIHHGHVGRIRPGSHGFGRPHGHDRGFPRAGQGGHHPRPHNGNVGSGQRSSTRVSPGMGRPSMGGARPMPRGGSPRGTFGGGGRSHGGGGGHFGGRR